MENKLCFIYQILIGTCIICYMAFFSLPSFKKTLIVKLLNCYYLGYSTNYLFFCYVLFYFTQSAILVFYHMSYTIHYYWIIIIVLSMITSSLPTSVSDLSLLQLVVRQQVYVSACTSLMCYICVCSMFSAQSRSFSVDKPALKIPTKLKECLKTTTELVEKQLQEEQKLVSILVLQLSALSFLCIYRNQCFVSL